MPEPLCHLWILFGSYTYRLPAGDLRVEKRGGAQRSLPFEAGWSHGRRLLSVDDPSFNCSTVHLVTVDGKEVNLDDSAVSMKQYNLLLWFITTYGSKFVIKLIIN